MKFALSTNWNNTRLNDGAQIADEAQALGFDSLELGYGTTPEQLVGWLSYLAGLQARPQPVRAAELSGEFDWSCVRKENIAVDSVLFY